MDNKKIKVLLIEDSVDNAIQIQRKLENSPKTKFEITTVKTLENGLNRLAVEHFDLVISDLGLPDSQGLNSVKQILTKAPHVPLVVLSGLDDESVAINAVKAGAQDYLVKGQINEPQLERSLHYSIERARLHQELDQRHREIINYQTNLNKILEKNADAILITNKNNQILFSNPAAALLLGHEQKELQKEKFNFKLTPGKMQEIEILQPDATIKNAEMTAVDIEWENQPASLVSIHEITQRKRMEQAVTESEEKFSKIFLQLPESISITRVKDGTFLDANESFCQNMRLKRSDLINHTADELGLRNKLTDRAMMIKQIKEQGRIFRQEYQGFSANGEPAVTLISADIIDINNEPCIVVIANDISERKKIEKTLKESEEKFFKVFQHSPEIILITELEDGKIFEANDSFMRLTGYTRDEVIGQKITALNIWSNPNVRKDMVKTIKEKGMVIELECQVTTKNGEPRTWLLSGEIINIAGKPRILAVIMDITERKKMEDRLRFSDIALKSIREGVFALDNEYRITQWNEMCEQMFGTKASDAVGKPISDVVDMIEELPGQNEKRMESLLSKGFNREEQKYRTSRGEMWVDVQTQKIVYDGKDYGWLTLLSDISERKKMEEILRLSDLALKSIHEGVYAMDNDLKVTYWNETCEQMFGVKASDAMGKQPQDSMELIEGYKGQIEQRIDTIMKHGFASDEQIYRTTHGDIWVDVQVQAIEYNGKRYGWLVLLSDITARKKVEEELRRSEEKYRELINTTVDGIIVTDADMLITLWNPGAESIFGYAEKEMIGQPFLKIAPKEFRKSITKGFGEYIGVGNTPAVDRVREFMGVRKDGSPVPVEISMSTRKAGDSFVATGIMRDITRRKRAEDALKQSEEKYRELINTSNDAIVSVDSHSRFILWNHGAEKMLGYTEKEALGLSLLAFFPDASQKKVARELVTLKKTGTSQTLNKPFETNLIRKDCSLVPVEMAISTRKAGDKIISTAIMRDITVRKEAEAKMRQIDQMKSDFLSNVSHELRTPLQSIGGFTKLILNGEVPDLDTQKEFLQIVDQETAHLGTLINSLLDMSRLEAGRFQINRKPTAMREPIVDALKIFESLARQKNVKLQENIPADLPEISVDGERMRQVIVNLVGNAVKFSDPGGSVMINAEIKDNMFIFHVADHGTGIHEENIKHLFERFYREEGEKVRGGTGLGLYISKQIIDAHGGCIWAESTFGKGSTFSFSLPLDSKGGAIHG
jgi:PAS domain S-box-containing protein